MTMFLRRPQFAVPLFALNVARWVLKMNYVLDHQNMLLEMVEKIRYVGLRDRNVNVEEIAKTVSMFGEPSQHIYHVEIDMSKPSVRQVPVLSNEG